MTDTPPSRYCSKHPHGSAGPCRLCDHAIAAHAEWQQNRAQSLLATAGEVPVVVAARVQSATAVAHRVSMAERLHLGPRDPEASHRGYIAATAELTRLRAAIANRDKSDGPVAAVCLDCGRPGPIAHLTARGGDTRCAECWAGETARARAISAAIEYRADRYH
jgi:hypothetical protein